MKLFDLAVGYLLGNKDAREWLAREIVKLVKKGSEK